MWDRNPELVPPVAWVIRGHSREAHPRPGCGNSTLVLEMDRIPVGPPGERRRSTIEGIIAGTLQPERTRRHICEMAEFNELLREIWTERLPRLPAAKREELAKISVPIYFCPHVNGLEATPNFRPSLPGERVVRYELSELVGKGSFASVYRASHVENGRPACVKVINPDKDSFEAGLGEIRILSLVLKHDPEGRRALVDGNARSRGVSRLSRKEVHTFVVITREVYCVGGQATKRKTCTVQHPSFSWWWPSKRALFLLRVLDLESQWVWRVALGVRAGT